MQLHYSQDGVWTPFGDWSQFLISVGEAMADRKCQDTRLVVGMVLPTRSYGAALATVGVVSRRVSGVLSAVDIDDHYRMLCDLEQGTPLTFLYKNRTLKALFDGLTWKKGEPEPLIRAQLHSRKSDRLTHLVQHKDCLSLQLAHGGALPLPKAQKGRPVLARRSFVSAFVAGKSLPHFAARTRLECVVVGPVGLLREELTRTEVSTTPRGKPDSKGVLQDIARARQFLAPNDCYRSEVLRTRGTQRPRPAGASAPHVAVFDGTAAFLKWRSVFPASHWLVLLDRSDPSFTDGAAALNAQYAQRIGDSPFISEIQGVPSGIEVVAYEERP